MIYPPGTVRTVRTVRTLCLFLLCASAASAQDVTFTRDIAPIVFSSCTSCHRPGGPAPFSLTSYDEVRRRATQVAQVTRDRFMPPWQVEPGVGHFDGQHPLTEQQIALIDTSMPWGDFEESDDAGMARRSWRTVEREVDYSSASRSPPSACRALDYRREAPARHRSDAGAKRARVAPSDGSENRL